MRRQFINALSLNKEQRVEARQRMGLFAQEHMSAFQPDLANAIDAWVREHQEKFDCMKNIGEMVELCIENFSTN